MSSRAGEETTCRRSPITMLDQLVVHYQPIVELETGVAAALDRSGITAERLCLEVTETVLVNERAIEVLRELHALGVRMAIDDFGTGFATLQYVTRLPVDVLKIDQGFVRGLGIDPGGTAIVRSVVTLAHELGLGVVAEGVETESQRSDLVELGCRLGQGWLFGRARPFDDVVEMLTASPAGPAPDRSRSCPVPGDEAERLAVLDACRILDTAAESAFDDLVALAGALLDMPIAMLSLVADDRQWFKSSVGIQITGTRRDVAFYAHAIADAGNVLVVEDATRDARFSANPLVTGRPGIRFYAGAPVLSRERYGLGALCVIDRVPRRLDDGQTDVLRRLAGQAAALLDLRRRSAELGDLVRGGSPVVPRSALDGPLSDGLCQGVALLALVRRTSGPDRAGTVAGMDQPDPDLLKLFSFALFSKLEGAVTAGMVHLGDRLGLYAALRDADGPLTSAELAAAAGLHERWVREWIHNQAAARLVRVDEHERFSLSPEAVTVLATPDHPAFGMGMFHRLPQTMQSLERMPESFRTGLGHDYDSHGCEGAVGIERSFEPWSNANLVPVVLPALDGVVARLEQGAAVADVGCGAGGAVLQMASAFPRSTFTGYDISRFALDRAADKLAASGCRNAAFHDPREHALPADGSLDLVTTFDCIHDMTHPDRMVDAIRAALADDGTWLLVDIKARDTFAENVEKNPMAALMYGISVLSCMSSAMSAPDGAGLGTLGLPESRARAMAEAAGFTRFRRLDVDHAVNAFYEVRP